MTDERRRNLERVRAYVADLVPLFRLQHWEISVEDEPPDGDSEAAIWTSNNCHIARIRFADKHFADTPAEQIVSVAHELIHIVCQGWELAARDAIDGLDPTGKAWASERYERAMERDTDALSRAIAPFLPLPPEDERAGDD